MVYRIYVQKKEEFAQEANSLKDEIVQLLQIENLTNLKIINRYDIENIDKSIFDYAKNIVFSEPQVDDVFEQLSYDCDAIFAVESLPGQFNQRTHSTTECIQLISQKELPLVKTAKIYKLYGNLSANEIRLIKNYIINPIECMETSLKEYETLQQVYTAPAEIDSIENFTKLAEKEQVAFLERHNLAMDISDLQFCQSYFQQENREPTFAEIKIIDTYWSDHCRHTTFLTAIDSVTFEDTLLQDTYEEYLKMRQELHIQKSISLMDMATIVCKYLRQNGKLSQLDESDEVNACTVKIKVDIEGKKEDWLLLFKNETHNHPTEIEPFGGAATCIGGAIRDPLSGRAYVYSAMRISGCGNPLIPIGETIKGKLPQRKIAITAANGNSSYGNQIGVATGMVDEIYHEGFVAKHLELGAVLAAAPVKNVVRERPKPTDVVMLLGGKTGRDGCGGATGSSKSHTLASLDACGAEVQKGNAPEERKIQRLFRNQQITRLIKRCNDFGAGGVAVAIGELADGLEIDLDSIPKKYQGLNGLELAISESQERMAIVIAKEDVAQFIALAYAENLEATPVAVVTEEKRLVMKWKGKTIVNLTRAFLNSNGAQKHIQIKVAKQQKYAKPILGTFKSLYYDLVRDINICSKKGLVERFDSTIGANTVLMPFGGKYQLTPIQAMVHKIPVYHGETKTCSLMSWGYNPYIFEKNQFVGAYLAVVESIAKLIATGASFKNIYLAFQEYFEKLGQDAEKWGKPLSAMLGAFLAQKELEVAAIGGKDSMSGTFENLTVPPTLLSIAVTTQNIEDIISPEFKEGNNLVFLLQPEYKDNGLPSTSSLKKIFKLMNNLVAKKVIRSAYTLGYGGIAEAIFKMSIGNKIGFVYQENISLKEMFAYGYGSFIIEIYPSNAFAVENAILLGRTIESASICYKNEKLQLEELLQDYENKLQSIYNHKVENDEKAPLLSYTAVKYAKPCGKHNNPKVLIPVFFGTNCEYDVARRFDMAGANTNIFVINNQSPRDITKSIERFATALKESQILFIPGGFSGADEPDGSAKLIAAFFRNPQMQEAIENLLEKRDGLIGGICNGFQALIKLGLIPYGKIMEPNIEAPTLTYNTIQRHQSKMVHLRVASNKSPWFSKTKVGEIYSVPISHGEGRVIASQNTLLELAKNGQITTQYVNLEGLPSNDIFFNPNGSNFAIEGLTSPDGRVFGKMGHSERIGYGLYKNCIGKFDMKIFEAGVEYFK